MPDATPAASIALLNGRRFPGVPACKFCNAPIQTTNYALGEKVEHYDPDASFRDSVWWHCRLTVATPREQGEHESEPTPAASVASTSEQFTPLDLLDRTGWLDPEKRPEHKCAALAWSLRTVDVGRRWRCAECGVVYAVVMGHGVGPRWTFDKCYWVTKDGKRWCEQHDHGDLYEPAAKQETRSETGRDEHA